MFTVGGAAVTSTATGAAAVLTKSGLPTTGAATHKVDGSRTQAPAAANRAPTFPASAPTSLEVAENNVAGAPVGRVSATDSDGDALTYALDSASDAVFDIDSTGAITVTAANVLDYETKASYAVTVSVHDGKDAAGATDTTVDATHGLTIAVTDVAESTTVRKSAALLGTKLTLTLDKGGAGIVIVDTPPLVHGFTVDGLGSGSVHPSAVAMDNRTVTLELGMGAEPGQTVTVSYDPDLVPKTSEGPEGRHNPLRYTDGTLVAAFSRPAGDHLGSEACHGPLVFERDRDDSRSVLDASRPARGRDRDRRGSSLGGIDQTRRRECPGLQLIWTSRAGQGRDLDSEAGAARGLYS